MGERKLYVASVMARLRNQYTHCVLYTRARSRKAAKGWFEREAERLYPSNKQWWTSTVAEEVLCS